MAQTEAVDTLLRDRNAFLEEVSECLLQAQQYAKRHYNGRLACVGPVAGPTFG
jgi:hypothetical protein